MLEFQKKRFGLHYRYFWFAKRPAPQAAASLTFYMQCEQPGPAYLGFISRRITVWVVDLHQSDEELLAAMKPRTRTDIRRAERDGVRIGACESKAEFLEFYNAFAEQKSEDLNALDEQIHWGENTLVLVAYDGEKPVVINHYVVDKNAGRARMTYSAAGFRGVTSSEERNLIGRASRLLHYKAMLHFKELGFSLYDFGEYDEETQDESLQKVNRFKACFGGGTEPCYKSQSLPMYLASNINDVIRSRF